MDWLALIGGIVKILSALSTYLTEKGYVKQGETEQASKDMAEALQELASANNLRITISAIKPGDLNTISEQQGWFRQN